MAARTSLTPAVTADSAEKRADRAGQNARQRGLSVPGGPHKTSEGELLGPDRPAAKLAFPNRWSCPINSSMVLGRSRSASRCRIDFWLRVLRRAWAFKTENKSTARRWYKAKGRVYLSRIGITSGSGAKA